MPTAAELRAQEQELEKIAAEKRAEAEDLAFRGDQLGLRRLVIEEERKFVKMSAELDAKEAKERFELADAKDREAAALAERDPRGANDLREEAEGIRSRARRFDEESKADLKRDEELAKEHERLGVERDELAKKLDAVQKEADEVAEAAEVIEDKADTLEGIPATPAPAPAVVDEAQKLDEMAKNVRTKDEETNKELEQLNIARIAKDREMEAEVAKAERAEADVVKFEDQKSQHLDNAVKLEERADAAEKKGNLREAEELREERDTELATAKMAESAAKSAQEEADTSRAGSTTAQREHEELTALGRALQDRGRALEETADKLEDKARFTREADSEREVATAARTDIESANKDIAAKIQESRDTALKQEEAFIKYRESEARLEALTGEKKIIEAKVAKMREEAKELEGSPDAELLKDQLKWREQRIADVEQRITQTTTDVKTFKEQSDTLYKQGLKIQEDVRDLHVKVTELAATAAAADARVIAATTQAVAIEIDPKELEEAGVTEATKPPIDDNEVDPSDTVDDMPPAPASAEGTAPEADPDATSTDPGESIDEIEPLGPVKIDTPEELQPAASSELVPDLLDREPAAEVNVQAAAAAEPDPSIASVPDHSVDLDTQPAIDPEPVPFEPTPEPELEPEPLVASVEPEADADTVPDPANEAVGID